VTPIQLSEAKADMSQSDRERSEGFGLFAIVVVEEVVPSERFEGFGLFVVSREALPQSQQTPTQNLSPTLSILHG
jgi:hypothetical protein